MNWRIHYLLRALIITMVLTYSAQVRSETVNVRVARGEDFGRLVFMWERPVAHDLEHQDGQVVIRFNRPLNASYQRVLGAMSSYIKAVQPGADGRSVAFQLTGEFETYSFDSGNAVIVEIAQIAASPKPRKTQSAVSDKTSVAQKSVAQATNSPAFQNIRVRTGAHETYTRIVFDWPKQTRYTAEKADGVVTVRFEAVAQVQIGSLRRRPPRFVGDVRSRVDTGETVVTLAVPATSTIKHFVSGTKVVLDVRQPSGSEDIAKLPPEPKSEPAPQQAKADEAAETAKVPKTPTPPGSGEAKDPAAQQQTIGDVVTKAPAKSPVSKESLPATPNTAAKAPTDLATSSSAAAGGGKADGKIASAERAEEGVATSQGQPLALKRVERKPKTPAEGEENSGDAAKAAPPAPVDPKAGVRFKFDWDEPVAAAVFRRVGYIWIIFDKASTVDVQSLLQAGGNLIQSIDQAPSPKATVLRMRVSRRINPTLSRDGLSWIIELSKQETAVSKPIEVNVQLDSPVGPRIFLPVLEPGKPVGITDPAVGDNLVVVPVIPLGHGLQKTFTYSQLRVLPSLQGIVIKPLVDDLRVRPLRQGVELTSGAKLALSPVSADAAARAKLATTKPLTNILELEKWEVTSIEQFNKDKQNLQDEVAAAQGEQRILERYNLARFYFANRFAPETLGVLAELKREEPEIENEREFRLIRGGASYLMGRLSDAASDFTHGSLDGSDEANFWRAAVVAEAGDLLAAAPTLTRVGVVTKKYPKQLKLQMGTLVADAAVEIGDIQSAKTYIKAMKKLEPDEAQLAAIEFVEGRMLNLKGDTDGAISKWEGVQEKRNKWMRARATIAHTELLLKLDRMKPMEAIKQLESLRFAWRGDDFEFALLRRLGGLYLDEGIYRNGLQALRQAATYFRNNEEAPQVTQQMVDVFNALYLEDGADAMPSVTAIAVYEEFKELTPAGAKGDEMIRKLADRLAGVDLLDQAAEILEGQIRFRLKGVLKAQVGARLAVVYLLARRYDRAVAALNATNEPGLSETLVVKRRHLKARALMGMDQREQSLELLKKDKANDADILRAEIFWSGGDWTNASQSLRKVVKASGAKKDKALTPAQAQHVLNYAISLVLSGNERGLSRVRRAYGRAVETTPLKDAFRLVSSPTALGLIDPASVQARVKLVENFKTFLSNYKKRLKERGLSGVMDQKSADAGEQSGEGEQTNPDGASQDETKGG